MTDTEEITYILRAVAEKPISGTDSSCAFCQAYGDEPHMPLDDGHECVVLTAQRLLGVVPLQHLVFLPEPPVAVLSKPTLTVEHGRLVLTEPPVCVHPAGQTIKLAIESE